MPLKILLTSQLSRTKNSLLFSFLNILANNFQPLIGALVKQGSTMKKSVFSLLLALLLSSCAMFPQTETELITNGNKGDEICFTESRTVVEDRIKLYLAQCFKPDFIFTTGVSGYSLNHRVKESKTTQTTIYNVYSPSGSAAGYFMNVKIERGNESCNTRVNTVVLNMFWEKEFKKIKMAVGGETPSCSM